MELTKEQIEAINKILGENNEQQKEPEPKSEGDKGTEQTETKVDEGTEQANNTDIKPVETPRVKLGTPTGSNSVMSKESLASKSVEWIAANLDEVNKIIGG